VPVADVDFVLMECTYGGREHDMPPGFDDRFGEIIRQAVKRGGKILIPSFAVERTQQVLYFLHDLLQKNEIPRIPVYVDSPLAVSATEIYRLHPESFSDEVYHTLFEKQNPFGFEELTLVRTVKGSKELNDIEGVAIIISASGMCEAGRILHHLRNNIENPRTTILLVGYCAEGTLGRKIRDGAKDVNILGDTFHVGAHIDTIDSFSGHADHSELVDYYGRITGAKTMTWLVHGESDSAKSLQSALTDAGGNVEIGMLGKEAIF
jgi:metallo-beta-lactamase family protein